MLIQGDCLEVLKKLEENSVDSIVTDPPYGLSFMGKKWDYDVPSTEIWKEALRVLKPGGYLLAFAGTRTQHRMAVNIEDAGFEIRDMIAWVYGSGFPKSLNIGKAVDKLNGREFEDRYELGRHIKERREVAGLTRKQVNQRFSSVAICQHWEAQDRNNALPPTPAHWEILKEWLGCDPKYDGLVDRIGAEREVTGVGNKPKPTYHTADIGGDAQANVYDITAPATEAAKEWEGWGTALKPALEPITVARKPLEGTVAENVLKWGTGGINIDASRVGTTGARFNGRNVDSDIYGKYGTAKPKEDYNKGRFPANLIHDGSEEVVVNFPNDNARFFYCAKASKKERGDGNNHPTVKPLALMEYLVKLVSKEGATVLDPFMGSGSTGIACASLGREFIGIEREEEYVRIAEARIASVPQTLFT